MGDPLRVGIIGLGVISRQYLDTLRDHPTVRITAVADIAPHRAAEVAAQTPGAHAIEVDELLADPDVGMVLNLTVPAAHADIALRAIAAGKGVYGEKPLAANLPDAAAVVRAGADAGLRVLCAPDTVLGTGIQTARSVIERGAIGHPVGAAATWSAPGHEAWHPHPDFYYRDGGGPLLDMGPYYLTSLCHLLGPIAAVTGRGSRRRSERTIASGPRTGERVPVEVDTHVVALLEHVGGALSTVTVSFDSAPSAAPPIEVFGERASLVVPDPNRFDGDVILTDASTRESMTVAPEAGYVAAGRGIGLVDAARSGDGRASGHLALHVLEVMTAILTSARSYERIAIDSRPAIPPLVDLTDQARWRAAG